MGSLLIEHIAQLVTCDGNDRILQDVDLYAENGVIRPSARISAKQRTSSSRGGICCVILAS